jgi:hypothetical protein
MVPEIDFDVNIKILIAETWTIAPGKSSPGSRKTHGFLDGSRQASAAVP